MADTATLPNLRVSYSSLNTYDSCRRKFELTKMLPTRPARDETYATGVGKAMHAGFQDYLVHKDEESAIMQMMLNFPFALEYEEENDYRSFEACLATFEAMFESGDMYEYELAHIRRPNTAEELKAGLTGGVIVPAIEVPFEIRFEGITLPDGRGISFVGYIDAIMRNRMNGRYRTLDIKTTRENIKDATGKYMYDTQQVPYGIVVDHVAEGKVDSFDVLYLDTYIDILEPHVRLYEFTKTVEDVQEWYTNRIMQLQDIVKFETAHYYPRTDSGCMFWRKPCRFLEICGNRDRDFLTAWMTLGDDPPKEEEWFPWIVTEVRGA